MPELCETDVLAWSERQAELIRHLAADERVNAEIDWLHVVEEVHDVGISELRACESLLQQAMRHLLKFAEPPASDAVAHWQDETGVFLDDAKRRFAPTMRQRLDLEDLYAKARQRSAAIRRLDASRTWPAQCPWSLDALLQEDVATLQPSA